MAIVRFPDLTLKLILDSILAKIRNDYINSTDKTESFLGRLYNGLVIGNYNVLNNAVKVFNWSVDDPNKIDTRLMFDRERANIPTIHVNIPAGIENGSAVRLSGKGMPGSNGNGDLYLQVSVDGHDVFSRDNFNIRSVHKIDYIDAILGIQINIDTIHGKVKLKIPPYTQPNSILKIKKKGIKTDSINGDHLAVIDVYIPDKMSEKEIDYLKKIKETR